jgi:septal ring factor EnvC (AmiA/AmiB activator)
MLLNEFIKEHRKVESQEATIVQQRRDFEIAISQLKKEIKTLAARLKEQAANLQNVSAQLALSRPGPEQAALNTP